MLSLEMIIETLLQLKNSNQAISNIGYLGNRVAYYGLIFSENKVELINLYQKYSHKKDHSLEYYEVTEEFLLCQHDFITCIKAIRQKYQPHEYCKPFLKKE